MTYDRGVIVSKIGMTRLHTHLCSLEEMGSKRARHRLQGSKSAFLESLTSQERWYRYLRGLQLQIGKWFGQLAEVGALTWEVVRCANQQSNVLYLNTKA